MSRRFLHIDASPRGGRSRSRSVACHLISRAPSDIMFDTLDIWAADLPELGGSIIAGRYELIGGGDVPADIAAMWSEVRAFGERFLAYDGYLVSTPMWNFGLPYRLKHYIDVLTQPGVLFSNNARGDVTGHAAGKTAVVVAASAMPFGSDEGLDSLDFQLSYLAAWFGFIGIPAVRTIRAAPTFGEAEDVERAMTRACDEAEAMAAAL